MKGFAAKIMKDAYELLNNPEFLEKMRKAPVNFIRERKLNFPQVVLLSLNLLVKSLQIEIDGFLGLFKNNNGTKSYSKQAFSKSRMKIRPEAYKTLFSQTVDSVFAENVIDRNSGFRFFAIDGTTLMLPDSEPIREKFSPISGSYLPHARASLLYDVISGYTVDAIFDSITTGERDMAIAHLESVKSRFDANDVVLADRGYPSKAFINYFFENDINFILRLQKSFSAEIDNSAETDFIWQMKYRKTVRKVRVIKILLDSGVTEILITNLFQPELKEKDFMVFYGLRWGIETRYNTMKNKFEVEQFSGKTPISSEQDFYGKAFLMNLEAAIKQESDEIIREEDKKKKLKYPRKTNENLLVGSMKNSVSLCLAEADDVKREERVQEIINNAAKHKVSVRPNRSFPRSRRSHKRISAPIKKGL